MGQCGGHAARAEAFCAKVKHGGGEGRDEVFRRAEKMKSDIQTGGCGLDTKNERAGCGGEAAWAGVRRVFGCEKLGVLALPRFGALAGILAIGKAGLFPEAQAESAADDVGVFRVRHAEWLGGVEPEPQCS